MQFLFAPLWGRFSDRFGRRRTMLLTLAGTGLALTFLGFASSLWGLFAARILGGGWIARTERAAEAERALDRLRVDAAAAVSA